MKRIIYGCLIALLLLTLAGCGNKTQTVEVNSKAGNDYFSIDVSKAVYNFDKNTVTVKATFTNKTKVRMNLSYTDKGDFNCGVLVEGGKVWEGEITAKINTNNDISKTSFFVNVDPGDLANSSEIANYDLILENGECKVNLNLHEKAAESAIKKFTPVED